MHHMVGSKLEFDIIQVVQWLLGFIMVLHGAEPPLHITI